jgi:TPR repeat protein
MSILPRLRIGKDRETEQLRQRVQALQAALKHSSERADRWTEFRRGVTAAIALLMLALGFALGVYREPVKQSFIGVARAIGLAKPAADEPYAAYRNGDYATALRLARLLAGEENDATSQSLLGLMFFRGQGVSLDYREAAKWFRLAADQGDVDAQYHLGLMYSEGLGVPQDHAEMAKWFRLAADQGDAQAQYNLGVFYSKGQAGRQPDFVSAYMWFNLAAAHFKASDPRRSTAISSRDLMEKQLTPEQLAEAQRRAREWTPA